MTCVEGRPADGRHVDTPLPMPLTAAKAEVSSTPRARAASVAPDRLGQLTPFVARCAGRIDE